MKPSNPALRVRGYDKEWNLLNGPATVTVYEVSEYYDKYGTGDWVRDEWKVNSYYFGEEDEINALFWLWPTGYDVGNERNNYFKVIVDKENYGSGVLEYIGLYDKYTEMGAIVYGSYPEEELGDIKISFEKGTGLTDSDMETLIGNEFKICSDTCYTETISSSLVAVFYDIPLGSYYAYGIYDFIEDYQGRGIDMPISTQNTALEVNTSGGYGSVKANLGYYNLLGIKEENGDYLDADLIGVESICAYYSETGEDYCSDYDGVTWASFLYENPYTLFSYDYDGSDPYSGYSYNLNLTDLRQDGGAAGKFDLNFTITKGYKEFFVEVPNTDLNLCEDTDKNETYPDGINYFEKGTVEGYWYGDYIIAEDACGLIGEQSNTSVYSCEGTDCKLFEQFCNGNMHDVISTICENGCEAGRCK